MMFNATFNNNSVKLWWSVLLVEKARVPVASDWQTLSHYVHLAMSGIRTHNISDDRHWLQM
jgi:hypothetical protein